MNKENPHDSDDVSCFAGFFVYDRKLYVYIMCQVWHISRYVRPLDRYLYVYTRSVANQVFQTIKNFIRDNKAACARTDIYIRFISPVKVRAAAVV